MKFGLPKLLLPTESEVRANHAGMNTFFGAVLGFVMAGTEWLDTYEFAYLLFIVSGAVISILYVSASRQKILYSLLSLALIFMLPGLMRSVLDPGEAIPDKLQATLLVWTFLSILVEFLPRRADDKEPPSEA